MKTNLPLILATILFSVTANLQAQSTIHSTTNGGWWPDNITWIEAVPGAADSVVLLGSVGTYSYSGWCHSLNITSSGSLGGNGNQGNLFIYGSMYNNGNITGSINYNLKGNLVNNMPWNGVDNHLQFTGMNQSISCAPGASINAQLQADDSLQNFSFLTDVILNTTQASNLGFSQLEAGKHKLSIVGGQFTNCRIHSDDTLQFDTHISSLDISGDFKLKGQMICGANVVFYEKATNFGEIYFLSGIGGVPLKLKGEFINKGIMDHSWVQVEKDISNSGTWSSRDTQFTGPGDKHISQTIGHPFDGTQFTSDNSGSVIFLDTDVEFATPIFHLNNNTLNCGEHTLTANTVFYDGTIISNAEIEGNNDFWNSTIKGDILLSGNNRFSNQTMDGVIENKGTLREIQYYGGFFKSYNQLINHNSIQSLQLKIFGDLTNYGTIDNNSSVEISGNIPQYLNFTQSIESPTYFFSNIEGNSYQWMKDGSDLQNQVSQKLSFSSMQLSDAGVYKCRVITGTGETVYSREIIVNNTTSVVEDGMISEFRVFPNPFFDRIKIEWNQNSTTLAKIDLLDVNGKLIRAITNSIYAPGENEIEINFDYNLAPGIYLLQLNLNGKTQIRKLVCSK